MDVAIVGAAGRWPGAKTPAELWRNISNGVGSITRFSGADAADALGRSRAGDYVGARSILDDVEFFDPGFFGLLPKDAEVIDPQHRVFLECCWEALEDAGYDPESYSGAIGVVAGCAVNTYFLRHLCADRKFIEKFTDEYPLAGFPTLLGTINDTFATRVSYKLNLRGPSFSLQSACSTSLVAISQACQSLLSYQCDMMLAGGVAITFPQKRGYRYDEGSMGSADGSCRPFDARANGTVFGNGAGVVLLKRLDDATADGDHIYAVIKGFAVNNDGAGKVGFTAPSVDGQATVIASAQALAGASPETIGYLEAHGTATPLGDPIEFAALTRAFRAGTNAKQFCALGSVKRNLGHLEMAAGVTGVISAAQMLKHRQIPPANGFENPNPNINLESSPFYVSNKLTEWKPGAHPRRAGVSSFGVGGTNAHIVLEEAPTAAQTTQRPAHLLVLSARSATALEAATANLANHLKNHPDADLGAVAYTLQAGRRAFEHRRTVVCTSIDDAISALESTKSNRIQSRRASGDVAPIVFMFPGQGSQYVGMGRGLYEFDAAFRADIDKCGEILRPHLGIDLREVMFGRSDGAVDLKQTCLAQPSLFVLGYATARLWQRWGVEPQAMIGHSVGEFVAACLAGVFSLEDALAVVATRGRLCQDLPPGTMLSVRLSHREVLPWIGDGVSLAAVNGPQLCVVAGPDAAVAELEGKLAKAGVASMRLATSHAFHSAMMDPAEGPFTDFLNRLTLREPQQPFVSSVTGDWITPQQATDPAYWARHMREPVLFAKSVERLRAEPGRVYLETGPGSVLCKLVRQHREGGVSTTIASLPDESGDRLDAPTLLGAAGALWLNGVTPDWKSIAGPGARRCSLPTYPFERQRCWVDPPTVSETATPTRAPTQALTELPLSVPSAFPPALPLENTMPQASPASSRIGRIQSGVIDVVEKLSGMDLSDVDPQTGFLELGFDSLFLTQVSQELTNRFDVKVTFRQLLDQESSPSALAAHLDAKLPADALPAEAPSPATAVPVAGGSVNGTVNGQVSAFAPPAPTPIPIAEVIPAGTSAVEAVMRTQLQVMSQLLASQLEVLRGSSVALPATPVTAALLSPSASTPTAAPAPTANEKIKEAESREFKAHGRFKPVTRGPVGGLTPQQTAHIDALSKHWNAKTPSSKKLAQDRRKVLADPRTASGFRSQWKEMVYPIATVRSRGSRLWDVDGNEFIDIVNGFGPILFGHAPDFVTEAVAEQLELGFETGPSTPLAGECAELVCELTGNERTTFCNTGSEAVMAALRLARTVTGRRKVVMFTGDYHGTFDEVLAKGAPSGPPRGLPLAPGICPDAVANIVVLDYGAPESLEYIRNNARELAAVLVEPVQSRHPSLQPVEFLREVRKITEASETALIFDEVVTGFRTHPGGLQALFGIRADLATYGKVAGGGMPVGILSGRAKFMDALDGGAWQFGDDSFPEVGVTFFAGTFVRHPIAMAATRAVLRRLKQEGPALQLGLAERVAILTRNVNRVFDEFGIPAKAEQFSSWFYFGFGSDQPYGSLLYYHLRAKGVFVLEGFPCFLTTAHSDADMDAIVSAFRESAAAMREAGFFAEVARSVATLSAPPAPELPLEAPLTEPQVEVLLSARLGDDASCAFNEAFTLRLQGRLDEDALRGALDALVARHDSMRATIDPGGERLRVADAARVESPLIDLSGRPDVERNSEIEALLRSDAAQPFDLEQGPLVRMKLLKLGAEEHLLLFTSHHIVFDGWSTNVVLGELAKLYEAKVAGMDPSLRPAPSYRKYALDQARWKQSTDRAEVEAWWASKFQTPVSPLELPTDRPRGPVKSFNGDTARRVIGTEAYQRIKKFGAQQGCTLFATLLAGFKSLVHRLSGQNDIVVGIPSAGQSQLDDGALVGHGVNFLPLRTSFDGDPTVGALLKQVRGTLLDAYDHQNYTFGSLVQRLGIRRDPSRLPLVEIQFNLEKFGGELAFSGLRAEADSCPKAFVNFDLFLNIAETATGLVLTLDYNTDLFDRATVERWLTHYETLLDGMAADATRQVSATPMLTPTELRRLTIDWNETRQEYPRELCTHQLIEVQAARTPNAIAVVCGSHGLTYGDLERGANRIANFLRRRGVSVGDRVVVCLERSTDMLPAVLGVMKTGAAYVPLDPEFPKDRIAMVVEDAEPSLIVTQSDVAARLSLPSDRIVRLDADGQDIKREADSRPSTAATADDAAYIIFTSGSTGKPKGVQIPHRAVVNFLTSMAVEPGVTTDDVLLAVTTLSFDIAVLELYLPLTVGGRVELATRDAAMDGDRLLDLMKSSGATIMQATPATWRLLLEVGWKGDEGLKVFCGGEALPRDLADSLLARAGEVWNMYGPTETTVWSAVSPVESGAEPVRVGPPIANTEFYVLDQRGQPVPLGVAGELHIGGDGLATGYWRRPELTASKFIPDPFRPGPNRRLYKTGDLVRPRPDGTLEFLGRIDNQVKIRGFRIETGDVEHALKQCPGVHDCVVTAREDAPGEKQLVAYVVPNGTTPQPGELRQRLATLLPAYMVPTAFVQLEAIPQTPNGKVDRRALPAPNKTDQLRTRSATAPRTPTERKLAEICAAVLKAPEVGVDDNLFDLGADSLRIFQIVVRAKDAGLALNVRQVLMHQTVSAIAREMGTGDASFETPAPTISAVNRDKYRVRTN